MDAVIWLIIGLGLWLLKKEMGAEIDIDEAFDVEPGKAILELNEASRKREYMFTCSNSMSRRRRYGCWM